MQDVENLVSQGLARWYHGRLIPVIRGGDPAADEPTEDDAIYAEVPDDLDSLSVDELAALIEDYEATIGEVTTSPEKFISTEVTVPVLMDETKAAVAALAALKAKQAEREGEPSDEPELSDEDRAAFEALGARETPEPDPEPEPDPDPEAATDDDVVVAAAPIKRGRPPRPTGQHAIQEHEVAEARRVPLLAGGGCRDMLPGEQFTSELALAEAMCRRHETLGQTAPGTVERFAIAKAMWRDEYPADRRVPLKDEVGFMETVNPVVSMNAFKQALRDRIHEIDKDFALIASGGLCAPVTPYYNLQYISVPIRPVMGSLPSFMADRGGLRYARPAALSAVTTAVGIITEEEDHAGGSSATKSCQVIPCPPFQETDVDTIFHCLQFGNLGARAFPELVAQWNNLVLAAHARLAESNLLSSIDAFSTQVTAGALGLGASATLFSQIMSAANGLRSRNRMDPDAVLRCMLPWWSVDLIVSDVIRSQFQRFDTDRAAVTALLRSCGIEPTFYIDSAAGREQVFGTQADGPLLPFPENVVWYLFPEGSFLYLDSGMLELGIVRDSVLNKTNDFQIFGETFEQVAFIGVEALAVESRVCDSGTVSLPHAVTCPIDYTLPS
jgi:hypothetical protein